MFQYDKSHCFHRSYDDSYSVRGFQTVEIMDLAFSRLQQVKIHEFPTQNYFYKNILMRKVRRIRDLLGLINTDSIDNILKTIVFEKYINNSFREMIEEEKIMQYLIEWEELNGLYVTERTEYITKINLLSLITYHVKNCSAAVQELNSKLYASNKMYFRRKQNDCEKLSFYFDFISLTFFFYRENKKARIYSVLRDTLKKFSFKRKLKKRIILYPEIDVKVLIRVTQLQRFNFASLWEENNNDEFPLNWTLLEGTLRNFNLLLLCGSPNAYNGCLKRQFFLAVLEFFEEHFDGNFPADDFYKNASFLLFQVIWLYVNFEDYEQKTNSLILLWRAIPDPFLSSKDFITDLIGNELRPFFYECFDWYYDSLISEGIQDSEFRSPRTLQHLALCSVRRSLTRNFVVPSDGSFNMENLELPVCLQNKVKLGVNMSLPNI